MDKITIADLEDLMDYRCLGDNNKKIFEKGFLSASPNCPYPERRDGLGLLLNSCVSARVWWLGREYAETHVINMKKQLLRKIAKEWAKGILMSTCPDGKEIDALLSQDDQIYLTEQVHKVGERITGEMPMGSLEDIVKKYK